LQNTPKPIKGPPKTKQKILDKKKNSQQTPGLLLLLLSACAGSEPCYGLPLTLQNAPKPTKSPPPKKN
jgi:hypothetical protein